MLKKDRYWVVKDGEMDLILKLLASHNSYQALQEGSAISNLFQAVNQAATEYQQANQQPVARSNVTPNQFNESVGAEDMVDEQSDDEQQDDESEDEPEPQPKRGRPAQPQTRPRQTAAPAGKRPVKIPRPKKLPEQEFEESDESRMADKEEIDEDEDLMKDFAEDEF